MLKVKIKDILNSNEKAIKPSNYDFIHYLDTSNITRNFIQDIQKLDTKTDTIPSRARRLVRRNTIIYSLVRPNLEHYGIMRNPLKNMMVSTGFVTLDVKEPTTYDANYVYYNLTQKKYTDYLHTIACNNVSSYPSINPSDIEEMKIEIEPNIEKQKKISNILLRLDQKIELNQKINIELEKIAKALYNYWFMQFDFPDEFGRPYKSSGGKMVYNEVLKREIPANWEVKHVKDFADVITGKEDANFSDPNGQYNFFTCGDEVLKCNEFAFCGKSILIAGNGNFNIKYFDGEFNAYQRTYVLQPKDVQYIGIIYLSAVNRIQAFTRGSSGSIVKFITKGDVENIPLLLPNNKNLLNIFNSLLDQQNHLRNEIERLTSLRDFLLPMLMNGQITINS